LRTTNTVPNSSSTSSSNSLRLPLPKEKGSRLTNKSTVNKKKDKDNTISKNSSSSSSFQVGTNNNITIMGNENDSAMEYNEEADEDEEECLLQDDQDLQETNAGTSIDSNTNITTGTSKESSSRNSNIDVGNATGNLYTSGLFGLGGLLGLNTSSNSSNRNSYGIHSQSERDLQARRQQSMLPITINSSIIPNSVTHHRINNSTLRIGIGSGSGGG